MKAPLLAQLARFGAVGGAATAVHSVVYLATTARGLTALAANFAGFACAVVVSYLGHRHWTFAEQTRAHDAAAWHASMIRFVAAALLGLASNTFFTWLLVEYLRLPKPSALFGIVFVTPVLVFVCSKYWAFAGSVRQHPN